MFLKPRVITVDKNPAYPATIQSLKKEKYIPEGIKLRPVRYLNNIVEQDHRFIKKRVHSMLGSKSFKTAACILSGVEAMHMIKKDRLIYGINLFKIKKSSFTKCLDLKHKIRFH